MAPKLQTIIDMTLLPGKTGRNMGRLGEGTAALGCSAYTLERLAFLEPEGRIGYRIGREDEETMDYLEFIARVTSHIPDKGRSWSGITVFMPMHTGEGLRKAARRTFVCCGWDISRFPQKAGPL